ncbi:hypothetical protein [Pseudarthrobacter sp. DSP2-3-2b1]|uniref:hypothetical protein n=1 Tax=Pseudarthrobacter sp. DSP2-3-2b1 TaxID=2804661 RepID=UPI003CE7EC9B
MTETVPEDDRRKASTEPGLDGEGDQYEEGGHAQADAGDRPVPEAAREVEVDEERDS